MSKLKPQSALPETMREHNDLNLCEITDLEIVSIAIANDAEKAIKSAFKKETGAKLPQPGHWVTTENGRLLWTGQNQYFLFQNGMNDRLDQKLGQAYSDKAYTTLQTDGWVGLEISGANVHAVLERFIALDLPSQAVGFGARTSAHHMSVIILKTDIETYQLFTPRSSSASFVEALQGVIGRTVL